MGRVFFFFLLSREGFSLHLAARLSLFLLRSVVFPQVWVAFILIKTQVEGSFPPRLTSLTPAHFTVWFLWFWCSAVGSGTDAVHSRFGCRNVPRVAAQPRSRRGRHMSHNLFFQPARYCILSVYTCRLCARMLQCTLRPRVVFFGACF